MESYENKEISYMDWKDYKDDLINFTQKQILILFNIM